MPKPSLSTDAPAPALPGLAIAAGLVTLWGASLVAGLAAHLSLDTPRGVLAVLGLIAVRTFLYVGLFITAHDAMHGVIAPGSARLNTLVGQLCLGLYAWLSFSRMRTGHMAHHARPASVDDPDWSANPRFLPWLGAFFRRYIDAWVIVRNGTVVTALYLGGVPLVNLLAVMFIPAWLSILQLFTFGTWLPHRPAGSPHVDEHRARSANVAPWLSFLRCYHFGYHWEHHAFPSLPWWRLPAARAHRSE